MDIKKTSRALAFIFTASGLMLSHFAFAKKFYIGDPIKRDVISFELSAPLEDIVGQTSEITGTIDLNLDDLEKSRGGKITVPAKSFVTGFKIRDQHMHETYLEVTKYPDIVFEITEVRYLNHPKDSHGQPIRSEVKLSDRNRLSVRLVGQLTFHGVKRPMDVDADISYFKETIQTQNKFNGDLVHLKTNLNVKLKDHLISVPEIVAMQVGEQIRVSVSLTGSGSQHKKSALQAIEAPKSPNK